MTLMITLKPPQIFNPLKSNKFKKEFANFPSKRKNPNLCLFYTSTLFLKKVDR